MQPNFDNPQPIQTQPNVEDSQQRQVPASPPASKPNRGLVIVLVIIIAVLVAGVLALGYFYKQEIDAHNATKKQLEEQTKIVNENAQVLRDAKLEPAFRKVLQDHANAECSSNSAILFNTTTSPEKNADGSTKKFFAVGQFVCNNGSSILASPVRFAAAQSYDGITWEFTYGSGTAASTSLPGYIFSTDPALYNRKYNNPESF